MLHYIIAYTIVLAVLHYMYNTIIQVFRLRVTNRSHWADGRWASIKGVRSTDRNTSLCSLFAEKENTIIQGDPAIIIIYYHYNIPSLPIIIIYYYYDILSIYATICYHYA